MFDFGIEAASAFGEIAYYGQIWLIEFRDFTRAVVLEDDPMLDEPEPNFILDEGD